MGAPKRSLAARIAPRSAAVSSATAARTASSCIAATTACASRAARRSSEADGGGAARRRDHEAGLREPQQRLADRGATDAQPLREVAVAQLLTRGEGAVDDRVAQPHVDVVAQQRPGQRAAPAGMGMQYIAA